MSDSDVVIIDDDPAPPRRTARRRAASNTIVIDSSPEEYQPTPRKTRKKQAQQTAAARDDADDGHTSRKQKCAREKQSRQKKVKEPVEKRTDEFGSTVRFSQSPSQAIYARIQRALPGSAHRMFLINTKPIRPAGAAGGRAQQFAVLGATGNVYDVTISRHPHCTCPDHLKGNLCKHILFVMLRVLKLATTNPLVWQKALLTKEVEEVLSGAHSQSTEHLAGVLADDRVRRAYAAAAGEEAEEEDTAAAGAGRRRPVEGDCPICYDELKEGGEALVWCESCGNNIHKACWDKWAATKRQNHTAVTCVYCRTPWHDAAAGGAAAASPGADGYINLAAQSAAHQGGASLEHLYGPSAHWISYHAGVGGSRAGAARMWRAAYRR